MGYTPYGYKVGLVPDHVEMETMARAHELKEQGLSLRDIASQLAVEGRLSRKGKPFLPQQVKVILGEGTLISIRTKK
jgi:hypothetical protein